MIIKKIRNKDNPQELAFYTYGNVPGQALLSGLIGLGYNIPAAPFREKNCGCKVMIKDSSGLFYDNIPLDQLPEDVELVTVYDPHNLIKPITGDETATPIAVIVTEKPKRVRPKKNAK